MGLSGGCGHSPSLTHDFLLLLPGGGTRNLYDLKVVSGILSLLVAGGGGSLLSLPQVITGRGPGSEVSTVPHRGSKAFLCVGRCHWLSYPVTHWSPLLLALEALPLWVWRGC